MYVIIMDIQEALLEDIRQDVPGLLRERRMWRGVSENLEVASKVIITAGGIVSYAACTDVFGDSRTKMIAFVGGSMNTVGIGCLNLAGYAKQQADEREKALQTLARHHNISVPNLTSAFDVTEP